MELLLCRKAWQSGEMENGCGTAEVSLAFFVMRVRVGCGDGGKDLMAGTDYSELLTVW